MVNWTSFDVTCKNKRAIFTHCINFTGPTFSYLSYGHVTWLLYISVYFCRHGRFFYLDWSVLEPLPGEIKSAIGNFQKYSHWSVGHAQIIQIKGKELIYKIDTFVSTWSFNDFSKNCHNFSVIIQRQRMLIPKTLMLNTFLLVMDELDLDAQFVNQFEDRNFRLLERLIFPGDSSRFNRQLFMKNWNFRVHRNTAKRYRNQIMYL